MLASQYLADGYLAGQFSFQPPNPPPPAPPPLASGTIIGFDWMKVSHDNLSNQRPQSFYQNVLTLVNANFPGTTHIAISTPLNTQAEFLANVAAGAAGAVTPAPLTIENFIDMQLDVIHNAGLNAVIRSIPCEAQGGIDGFSSTVHTSDFWVANAKAFLDTHVNHIKSGDIIALWYEGLSGQFATVVNDTGNVANDYNSFWQKLATMVKTWCTTNAKSCRMRTDVAGGGATTGGNTATASTYQAIGAIVHDHYGITSHTDPATGVNYTNQQIMDNLRTQIQSEYNSMIPFGSVKFYEQEWGDIRKSPSQWTTSTADGATQVADPGFTGQMADQVFFPLIQQGVMEGVDFWDLFNTPKEGILDFYNSSGVKLNAGSTSTAVTAKLNAKGTALALIFQKWFGNVTVTPPPPPPPPTTEPAPVTTIALSPAVYTNGQYANPTTVTFSATASSGYTIGFTYYKVDGGTQTTYSAPFTISGTGTHTVEFWSVDNQGVTESHNLTSFTIYTPAFPITTVSLTPPPSGGLYANPTTTTLTAKADPGPGNYFFYGVFTSNTLSDLITPTGVFEADAGKTVSVIMWYQDWKTGFNESFSASTMDAVRNHGSMPMITWESYDPSLGTAIQPAFSLSSIINGNYDSYITTFATAAKNWGHPFFLRLDHEMNGNWYPWAEGVNGNTTGQYVQMWKHVYNIFQSVGATNVIWCWCPNILPAPSTASSLATLYPGDAYVDWLGMDGYNWGSNFPQNGGWETFTQLFSSTYTQLIAINATKPIYIAETASGEAGGSKAAWITSALGTEIFNFPNIQGFNWFNVNKEQDWRIESSVSATSAFNSAIQNSAYRAASTSLQSIPKNITQGPITTIKVIHYQIDSGSQLNYTVPFTISGTGSHTLKYHSVDTLNDSEQSKTLSFTIAPSSATPPVTTISVTTTVVSGIYSDPATVALTATPFPGNTISATHYTIDGGGTQNYNVPFTVSGTGNHTVTYWSVDNAALTETTNTLIFAITAVSPVTTIALSPSPTAGLYANPTTVTLSALAGAGNTIAQIFYKLDGGGQITYSAPFTVTGSDQHSVVYWSVDNTGTIEPVNTNTFDIVSVIQPPTIAPPPPYSGLLVSSLWLGATYLGEVPTLTTSAPPPAPIPTPTPVIAGNDVIMIPSKSGTSINVYKILLEVPQDVTIAMYSDVSNAGKVLFPPIQLATGQSFNFDSPKFPMTCGEGESFVINMSTLTSLVGKIWYTQI